MIIEKGETIDGIYKEQDRYDIDMLTGRSIPHYRLIDVNGYKLLTNIAKDKEKIARIAVDKYIESRGENKNSNRSKTVKVKDNSYYVNKGLIIKADDVGIWVKVKEYIDYEKLWNIYDKEKKERLGR